MWADPIAIVVSPVDTGLLVCRVHRRTWTDDLRIVVMVGTAEEVAGAILRNGAVFLPDGLTGEDLRRSDFFDEQAAALAALRVAPLDVRMVVQAINAVAKRHGVAKDPPERPLMHIFGYTSATPDMDAEIAAEYAALAAAKETP